MPQTNQDLSQNQVNQSLAQVTRVNKQLEGLWQSYTDVLRSFNLVRSIGYILLILFAFDIVALFAPPNFTNPVWEFQTMGQIVERIAVPHIAYALIFAGGRNRRSRWEVFVLQFLSWGALIFGVVLLLMIPLGVSNTVRLDRQNYEQIATQVSQQTARIQAIKDKLKQATTEAQMEQLLSRLDSQGRTPDIENSQQLRDITQELSTFLNTTETNLNNRAQTTQKYQRIALFKNSIK